MEEIIAQITLAPAGGTVRLDGGEVPAHGYMVGHGLRGLSCPGGMVPDQQLRGALVWLAALPERPLYVGWWTDPESGRFYIEPSTWTANYNHAMQLADERGELAVFDIARQADIRLDEPSA